MASRGTNPRPITCIHCRKPFERAEDLMIVGAAFGMHPVHASCYADLKSRPSHFTSIKMSGWRFWLYLLGLNLLFAACLFAFPDSRRDIPWFLLIVNAPLLAMRLIAYFSYEASLRK